MKKTKWIECAWRLQDFKERRKKKAWKFIHIYHFEFPIWCAFWLPLSLKNPSKLIWSKHFRSWRKLHLCWWFSMRNYNKLHRFLLQSRFDLDFDWMTQLTNIHTSAPFVSMHFGNRLNFSHFEWFEIFPAPRECTYWSSCEFPHD